MERKIVSLKNKTNRRGFYKRALDEAEQLDFELAEGVDGIDDEITLLRVKIKSLLEQEPADLKLIMKVTEALAKLVQARYHMTREQKSGLKEGVTNIIREIAVPLGIAAMKK